MNIIEETRAPASSLRPGQFNYRKKFTTTELRELADNISAVGGLLAPLLVRRTADGYEIIAGERRWRAVQLLDKDYTLPIRVVEASDAQAAVLAQSENDQRKDPSPIEAAHGAKKLLEQFGGDQDEVCKRLDWSLRTLQKRLGLLQCSPQVQEALLEETILLGHAELIAAIVPENQPVALQRIIDNKLSVAQTKQKLADLSEPLANAIFDKTECATCRYNSAQQSALFGEALSEGFCTNAKCYSDKTGTEIANRAVALGEDYRKVHVVAPGDSVIPIKLVADGPMGVGAEQALACRGCANFGCSISKRPGSVGEVETDLCFDSACNAGKVAAHARLVQAVPNDSTVAAPVAPQPFSTDVPSAPAPAAREQTGATAVALPQRLKDYRESQWRRIGANVLAGDTQRGLQVLLALGLSGRAGKISSLKMSGAVEKITGRNASAANLEKSLSVVVEAAREQHVRLACVMAASAVFDLEISDVQKVLTFLHVDLTQHWQINKEFLGLLTRTEIVALCSDIGLRAHAGTEEWKKIATMKKPEMIAAVLAIEGFSFRGQLPDLMRYTAQTSK